MKPIIFRKEGTTLNRLEAWAWSLLKYSFFRFLLAGGLNTILGFVTTLMLRLTLFREVPKWGIIDWSNTLMFIILFPVSYTIQVLFTFRTTWTFKRLLMYPLSSLPNYFIQQGFILLFEGVFEWPYVISYALSAIAAIPVMFLIVRYLVVEKKPSQV
jgi:putative flippase GtrA